MLPAALVALALQITPAQRARIAWVPDPRAANGTWVSDAARHLRPATVESLNATIGALERETGVEIAVVVVDSLAGLSEQEFATGLHRLWGVGKRERNNGIVFLWGPHDRAVFISIGYGLEGAIPDRRAGRIRDQQVFAAFRQGRFDDGVLAGVRALAAAAREESAARQEPAPGAAGEAAGRGHGALTWLALGMVGAAAATLAGALGARRWRRRQPRPCPKCGTTMSRLGEEADDARLDAAAQLEERLGSVDWDVWVCPACNETVRIPYRSSSRVFEDCPECGRHTAKVRQRTQFYAPTKYSPGLMRIRHACANCAHKWTTEETIPMIATSSGGSRGVGISRWIVRGGGGGSGFGGGSAGGAGAGGRY